MSNNSTIVAKNICSFRSTDSPPPNRSSGLVRDEVSQDHLGVYVQADDGEIERECFGVEFDAEDAFVGRDETYAGVGELGDGRDSDFLDRWGLVGVVFGVGFLVVLRVLAARKHALNRTLIRKLVTFITLSPGSLVMAFHGISSTVFTGAKEDSLFKALAGPLFSLERIAQTWLKALLT
nr:hypothetical protein Iba_chr09bCG8230 [Ipomoea batatas]